MAWRENWTRVALFACNKDVMEYTETHDKFVCRTMQKNWVFIIIDEVLIYWGYWFWSRGLYTVGTCTNHCLWRRWSLSRPNESMRKWNRYGRIRRHRQRKCFRRKCDWWSNAKNNSLLRILYSFLEGSLQSSQKQKKDWRLYTVDINTIYSCSKNNVCIWYMLGSLYYSIILFDAVVLYIKCSLHKCITCIFSLSMNFDAAIFTFAITLEEVRTTGSKFSCIIQKTISPLTSRITNNKILKLSWNFPATIQVFNSVEKYQFDLFLKKRDTSL